MRTWGSVRWAWTHAVETIGSTLVAARSASTCSMEAPLAPLDGLQVAGVHTGVYCVPMAIALTVNGKEHALDVEPDMPLLWAIRETLGLTGTKYGCGISACGACTIHLDGRAVRSCTLPMSAASGKHVTTIEGLAQDGTLHRVQRAWVDHQVPQCGYCQSGMIMAVAGLLAQIPKPTDDDIDAGITNICRCGTFARVRTAIRQLADGEGAAS